VIDIKENLGKIRNSGKEYAIIKMGIGMREIGNLIKEMD
jgi:hypothetical protein